MQLKTDEHKTFWEEFSERVEPNLTPKVALINKHLNLGFKIREIQTVPTLHELHDDFVSIPDKKALLKNNKFIAMFGNDLVQVEDFTSINDLNDLDKIWGRRLGQVVTCWHYPQKFDIGIVFVMQDHLNGYDYEMYVDVVYNYMRRQVNFNVHPVHSETNVVMPMIESCSFSLVRHSGEFFGRFQQFYKHVLSHYVEMYYNLDSNSHLNKIEFVNKLDNILYNVSRSELSRMRDIRAIQLIADKSPFFKDMVEPYSYLDLMLVTLYLYEFGKGYADANSKFYNEMYLQVKKLRSELSKYSTIVWAKE